MARMLAHSLLLLRFSANCGFVRSCGGLIDAQVTDELDKTDLVLAADGPDDYLLAEISITVQQDDIDRAAQRARLLAQASGRTVTAFAFGVREQQDLRRGDVQVILIPERQSP